MICQTAFQLNAFQNNAFQTCNIVSPILDGCVFPFELINEDTWPDNVESSGFVDPVEVFVSSGYVKDPTKYTPWDMA